MVIVGQRVRTKAVADGRRRTMACSNCGRTGEHAEHRVIHTATLFFLPVANVVEQTVWCCPFCGTRVAEGDSRWLSGEQEGTAVGNVMAAVGSLAEEAAPTLRRLQRQVSAAVDAAFTEESERAPTPPEPRPPPEGPDASEASEPGPATPPKRRL